MYDSILTEVEYNQICKYIQTFDIDINIKNYDTIMYGGQNNGFISIINGLFENICMLFQDQ